MSTSTNVEIDYLKMPPAILQYFIQNLIKENTELAEQREEADSALLVAQRQMARDTLKTLNGDGSTVIV